jgi:outer membrane protein assembly factor BamB
MTVKFKAVTGAGSHEQPGRSHAPKQQEERMRLPPPVSPANEIPLTRPPAKPIRHCRRLRTVRKPPFLPGRAVAVMVAMTAALTLAACAPRASSVPSGLVRATPSPSLVISHPASAAAAAAHFKFTATCAGAAAAYDVTDAGIAAWAAELPGAASTYQGLQPVAVGGLAVFAFGNVISARQVTDGRQVWQRAYPEPAGSSAGDVGDLWLWHGELIALIAPTNLGQRTVDMRVQALSPATGAVRWTASLGTGHLYNDQVISSGGVLAVLTETGGADGLGKLMAFDLTARKLLWSRSYGKDELTEGPTAVGPVIVMAEHGTVTGFDARTGAVRWAHGRLPGPVESVAGPGDLVLLYTLFPQTSAQQRPVPAAQLFPVTALDATTGAVLWRMKTASPVDEVSAGDGMIVVGTTGDGRLTVLRPSGQVIWSVPEAVANSLTWVDTGSDLIYVSSSPEANVPTKVVDRRLGTGAVRWSTPLGGNAYANVVWSEGGNLIVTVAPGPGNTLAAALAVDPATGNVRAMAPLASLVNTPLTVAGGDTLMELTSAPCAGSLGPPRTASGH